MDPEHARELLARERARIERALTASATSEPGERSRESESQDDPGAHQHTDQLDEEIAGRLSEELEAIARAEQRLEDGTYGASIDTGEPIPDERLEVVPWAERTAAEEDRRPR